MKTFDENTLEDYLRLWATEDETWVCFESVGTKQENKAWLSFGAARPSVVSPKLGYLVESIKLKNHVNHSLCEKSVKICIPTQFFMLNTIRAGPQLKSQYFGRHFEFQDGCRPKICFGISRLIQTIKSRLKDQFLCFSVRRIRFDQPFCSIDTAFSYFGHHFEFQDGCRPKTCFVISLYAALYL